ncbi:hypothetical protein DPMN_098933 [Dreissena polymorpha]|uniref:Uncharacterized protein n=1 Tax=Dreissena polymorpha TaxID=45954 RepID=A0A9D4LFL5_DREPO|nr:hypothetical protein DPMN_098933 [Dreissena polymorpha]
MRQTLTLQINVITGQKSNWYQLGSILSGVGRFMMHHCLNISMNIPISQYKYSNMTCKMGM